MIYPPKPKQIYYNSGMYKRLIKDPNWICEPKKDGMRCLVKFVNGTVELHSRNNTIVSYKWLKELKKELLTLGFEDGTILDSELICKPMPKCELWLFDYPTFDGTLEQRRRELVKVVSKGETDHVTVVPKLSKEHGFVESLELGDEGVVFKDKESVYKWQRGTTNNEVLDWFKVKEIKDW